MPGRGEAISVRVRFDQTLVPGCRINLNRIPREILAVESAKIPGNPTNQQLMLLLKVN